MEPYIETYADLAARISAGPPRCGPVRLVAVDGPGGAGKSTFAARVASALGGVQVVHTDDFASWEDPTGWWPRWEEQVLRPLAGGLPGSFRAYDWWRREAGERRDVPVADVVVLEGVSAARRAVADRLTQAVWVSTGERTRLRRGLKRDGEDALELWRSWMAEEDHHFTLDSTAGRADVVVDGDPRLPHDPETAYVRLA